MLRMGGVCNIPMLMGDKTGWQQGVYVFGGIQLGSRAQLVPDHIMRPSSTKPSGGLLAAIESARSPLNGSDRAVPNDLQVKLLGN